MEEGLLSVCELTRALVNRGQLINIATFSTQDLQEQCHKSYVASLISGEQRIGNLANVFLWTTSMKVIHKSFLPWTIPNIRYFVLDKQLENHSTNGNASDHVIILRQLKQLINY